LKALRQTAKAMEALDCLWILLSRQREGRDMTMHETRISESDRFILRLGSTTVLLLGALQMHRLTRLAPI
jgi:hypothetical protein